MAACATTKKSTQTKEIANIVAQKTESETTDAEKLIDTTKTDKGKITITEIEFYPPTTSDVQPGDKASSPRTNVSGLTLPNVGNISNAAIKSIKQTTIESESEKKGESKESSSNNNAKSEATLSNSNKETQSVVMPAPDPYRWRYIFYILLLILAVVLYLKRIPILDWLKKILSNVRKIF
jgi:hypothetical protein